MHIIKRIVLLVMTMFGSLCHAFDIANGNTTAIDIRFDIESVVIGAPDIADFRIVNDRMIYVFGKSVGQTNIIVNGRNNELKTFPIFVFDTPNEVTKINALLNSSDFGLVSAVDIGDEIVLSGTVNTNVDLSRLKSLIGKKFGKINASYTVSVRESQQIKIRVTVAEVSKDITETLGIDWGQGIVSTSSSAGMLNINSGIYNSLVKGINLDSLGVAINALAKNNMADVLTTPSLTVTNGKHATFHGGGQIPIFQNTDNGSSVDWKDYGVKLDFAPTIGNDGNISIDITVESSQIGGYYKYENTELPVLNTRHVETSVQMKDGESFVLGGLIDNNQTQYVNKVPGLADVPILGSLFKSTGFKAGRSELVIFATVEFVKPTVRNAIALPQTEFSSPWEIFFDIKDSRHKATLELIKEADYVID